MRTPRSEYEQYGIPRGGVRPCAEDAESTGRRRVSRETSARQGVRGLRRRTRLVPVERGARRADPNIPVRPPTAGRQSERSSADIDPHVRPCGCAQSQLVCQESLRGGTHRACGDGEESRADRHLLRSASARAVSIGEGWRTREALREAAGEAACDMARDRRRRMLRHSERRCRALRGGADQRMASAPAQLAQYSGGRNDLA